MEKMATEHVAAICASLAADDCAVAHPNRRSQALGRPQHVVLAPFRKIALASLGLLLQPHAHPATRILVLKENPRLFEG
jgi:hypothetical protein